MARKFEQIIEKYRSEYEELRPLLDYFKARLTLDINRLVRNTSLYGRIFFTVRIKDFSSVARKLWLKRSLIRPYESFSDLVKDVNGPLPDILGIRFICLDERTIVQLINHLLQHNSIRIEPVTYYQSIINETPDNPLKIFAEGVGFETEHLDGKPETFRRYEDLNMYLFFDEFYENSSEIADFIADFNESAGIWSYDDDTDKLFRAWVNRQSEYLDPKQKKHIGTVPIEAQSVTFAMHLYNERQRPEYAARKESDAVAIHGDVKNESRNFLESLKLGLAGASHTIEGIARIYEGPFDYRAPLQLSANFKIEGRILADLSAEVTNDLIALNELAGVVARDSSKLSEYEHALDRIRTQTRPDIGILIDDISAFTRELRPQDGILTDKRHAEYWLISRLILMMHAIIAGFSANKKCVEYVAEKIKFPHKADGNVVMSRIYENISIVDRKVEELSRGGTEDVAKYFKYVLDPIIKWRQATASYQLEEYSKAASQLRGGLKLVKRRQDHDLPDNRDFYPSEANFKRRELECNWMEKWKSDQLSPQFVYELGNKLENLEAATKNQEKLMDRLTSYQSILGFQGLFTLDPKQIGEFLPQEEIHVVDESIDDAAFGQEFYENFVRAILRFGQYRESRVDHAETGEHISEHTLWWQLASCISFLFEGKYEEAIEANKLATIRFLAITWHPRSRLDHYRWILEQTNAICAAIDLRNTVGAQLSDDELRLNSEQIDLVIPSDVMHEIRSLLERFSENKPPEKSLSDMVQGLKFVTGLHRTISIVRSYYALIKALAEAWPGA